jgi:hypothetical protein
MLVNILLMLQSTNYPMIFIIVAANECSHAAHAFFISPCQLHRNQWALAAGRHGPKPTVGSFWAIIRTDDKDIIKYIYPFIET